VGDYLSRIAGAFDLRGGFLTWPHHMLFVVGDHEHRRQQVDVERLPPASFALAKLAGVGEVVDAVERGDLSPTQAQRSLDDIAHAPSPWGAGVVGLSYAVIGLGIAALLQGSWLDAALGAGLAVVVYAMVLAAGRYGTRWAAWLPLLTAFVPAVVASGVRYWIPEVDVLIVIIAAIAILLPGYAVSVGIGELVEDHVIAGWSNLVRGLVYLAKQVLGAWLGVAVVHSIVEPPPASAAEAVADAWMWLLMPLLIVGICVVFQTSRQDFLWATMGCALAFATSLVGDLWNANLARLARTQVAGGDLIVLNKVDLVDAETLARVHAWIDRIRPGIEVFDTTQSRLPMEILLRHGRADPPTGRGRH
jgi:uncharacterized membrane protein YjjP (DUF1212 family)